MLAVAASAAFKATADLSCSFTETETVKFACNTSNQGLIYLFIHLFVLKRKQKKRRRGRRKKKICHLLFFSLLNFS